jgi:predicted RNase H-like HicB family nuclease
LEELEIVTKLWIETAEKNGKPLPDVEGAIQKVKSLSYSGSR